MPTKPEGPAQEPQCKRCNGTGVVRPAADDCARCGGTGIEPVPATPAPSQPAGVREFNEYMGAELFRAQRDWLIAECARVGVTVNVIIGAPLEKAYRLDNAAERERDSLRELLKRLNRRGGLGLDVHEEIDAALKAGKGGQQ